MQLDLWAEERRLTMQAALPRGLIQVPHSLSKLNLTLISITLFYAVQVNDMNYMDCMHRQMNSGFGDTREHTTLEISDCIVTNFTPAHMCSIL